MASGKKGKSDANVVKMDIGKGDGVKCDSTSVAGCLGVGKPTKDNPFDFSQERNPQQRRQNVHLLGTISGFATSRARKALEDDH